jgi:hypothetical protein
LTCNCQKTVRSIDKNEVNSILSGKPINGPTLDFGFWTNLERNTVTESRLLALNQHKTELMPVIVVIDERVNFDAVEQDRR